MRLLMVRASRGPGPKPRRRFEAWADLLESHIFLNRQGGQKMDKGMGNAQG